MKYKYRKIETEDGTKYELVKSVKLQLGWEFSAEEEEYYQKTLERVKQWAVYRFPKKRKRYARRMD